MTTLPISPAIKDAAADMVSGFATMSAPSPKAMERRAGPSLSTFGLKLSITEETYVITPMPQNDQCCGNMTRLFCSSAPMYFERIDFGGAGSEKVLEYTHPHGMCWWCGCPPGSSLQAGSNYQLHERSSYTAKEKTLIAKSKCCFLNGPAFVLFPCCYSHGAQKMLSIVDSNGEEHFTLQRELSPEWYCNSGSGTCCAGCCCGGMVHSCEVWSNRLATMKAFYAGKVISIYTLPVFGPLPTPYSPRIHVGNLSVRARRINSQTIACVR